MGKLARIFSAVILALSSALVTATILNSNAYAAGGVLMVDSIEIAGKTSGVEASASKVDDLTIQSAAAFHQTGDYVEYRLSLKNTSSQILTIDTITSENNNSYIDISYDDFAGTEVGAGQSFDFVFRATFESDIADSSARQQNLNLAFSFTYQLEDGETAETIVSSPNTGDGILSAVAIFGASILGIVAVVIFTRKKLAHRKLIGGLVAIAALGAGILIPYFASANDNISDIAFVGNFEIFSKLIITVNDGTSDRTIEIEYGDTLEGLINDPEMEGYNFSGWLNEDGSDFDITAPITSDVNIHPDFDPIDYTIALDTDNDGTADTEINASYDTPTNLPTNEATQTGYKPNGWKDEDGNHYDDGEEVENLTTTDGDIINLVPDFEPINYTIAIDTNNDGTVDTEIDATYNQPSTLPTNESSQTGYKPNGWKDESGNHYDDGEEVENLTTIDGATVNITPDFEPISYTIALDTDNDGTADTEIAATYDTPTNLPTNNSSQTGYIPNGWKDEDGNHYDDGEEVENLTTVDGDTVNLTPDFSPIAYVIEIDTDADGDADVTLEAFYDQTVQLPTNEATQTGYKPNGWKDEDGNHYDDGAEVKNLTTTNNDTVSLEPDFTPINYIIALDTNNDGTADVTIEATYGEPVNLPTNEATQTGYNPNGWKDTNGNHYDSGAAVENLTATDGATVTLVPDFTPINYTVALDTNNDGTADTTINAVYGQSVTLPTNNATKPGNQPNGWKDTNGNHYDSGAEVENLTTTDGATVNLVPDWRPNHYSVWIDANNNWNKDAGESYELDYGDTLNLGTNTLQKTGCTPNGWKDLSGNHYDDGANIGNIIANDGASIMITPDFIPNESDVAIDLNGDGNIEDSERFHVVYGHTSVVLPVNNFVKAGHDPVGWVDNNNVHYNDGTDLILIDIPNGSSIMIVPNFVPIRYDVLFDSDGDGTVDQTYHISYGAQEITLPDCDATRGGYRCVGWTDGTNYIANGTNIGSYDSARNGDSLTISPKWVEIVYQIEFVKNNDGFSSGSMLPQQVTYAQEFTIPESGFNVASYDFIGWATSAGGDVVYTPGQTASKLATEEGAIVKLYAKWTPRVYTIRYENVDDDEFMAQALTTVSLSDFASGSSIIEIPGKPKKVGHAHSGWKHNNNDSCSYISTIDKSDLPASGSEYVLTACYNTTMINFMFGSGVTGNSSVQGSVNGMTVKYGEPKELPLPPYTRTGYTVSAWWYKDGQPFAEGGKVYNADEYIEQNCVDKSVCYVSLSANWTPHAITLHISPGEGVTDAMNTIDDQQVTYGAPVNFANFGTFSRPGYIQNGWKLGDTTFGNSFSTNSWAIDGEELTLEAKWRAARYNIDFNANADDAINEMPSMTNIEYGSGATLTLNNFSRSGYDFVGWKVDNAGELIADGASADFPISANNQTVHLYAQWRQAIPTITYNANGGTGNMETQSSSAGATVQLKAPEYRREGFAFVGWNTKADGTGTNYGANEYVTMPSTGMDLYAKWVAPEQSVTMQSFDKSNYESLPTNSIMALRDERDNEIYPIAKMADGNWWMINNLRLDLSNPSVQITASNTNNPTTSFMNAANNHPANSVESTDRWWCGSNADCTNSITYLNPNRREVDGVYYNTYTATAGRLSTSTPNGYNDAQGDLCPSGWRLPLGSTFEDQARGEFVKLNAALGGSLEDKNLTNNNAMNRFYGYPFNFIKSGSDPTNDSLARDYDLGGTLRTASTYPGNDTTYLLQSTRYNMYVVVVSNASGYPMRCIAK